MAAPVFYTAEMVRAIPVDGNRYETVYGELLVTPAPGAWHQEVIARLSRRLVAYLDSYDDGHLFVSPADLSWGADILVQPDLFVVRMEQAKTMEWSRMQDLLLAVEVLSPSTARYDRFTKRRLYQNVGVPWYWVVDPSAQAVEVWGPANVFPTVETEAVVWRPLGATESLKIELDWLFRPL